REHDGREEVHLEDSLPILELRINGAETRAAGAFGADSGIVDQRFQPRALILQALAHLLDGAQCILRIRQIDLDMVLRPHLPRAILWEWLARASNHPPSGGGEPLYGGVANPARGAGKNQSFSLGITAGRHGLKHP